MASPFGLKVITLAKAKPKDMPSHQPDWTAFTKRIFIDKPIKTVYEAWTIPANLSRWFLEEARYFSAQQTNRMPNESIQKDDHYLWKWHNWDFTESGRILEANGSDRVSFTFGKAGHVHIQLKERDGSTEVRLLQDGIPEDEEGRMNFYVGCSTGWTFWLTNLKAWLEYGITLNAKGFTHDESQNLANS